MKESVRIFRFIVIGTMNALIMALVVWLMMKEMSFDGDYMVANITAYLIAQIHNFIWCKYWIFPVENKKNSIWKQILLFCSAFAVAYTAQFLFLVLLVEGLDVNESLWHWWHLSAIRDFICTIRCSRSRREQRAWN